MFLLLLMGLGAASVKAQVRIGGNTAPNPAAVLDLNANDDATPVGNKGALALPRVSLASTTAQLNGVTPITGMLVFNTNASMTNGNGVGMYFWNGSSWVMIANYAPEPINSVHWLLALDTSFTTQNLVVGGYYTITSPRINGFEICNLTPGWGRRAQPNSPGVLVIFNESPMTLAALAARVLCYRPSLPI